MYGVRLVGTNRWVMRIPGHSKVIEGAGSTWSSPPKNLESFWNRDILDHVTAVEGFKYDPGTYGIRESNAFNANISKYLEVVKIAFVEAK